MYQILPSVAANIVTRVDRNCVAWLTGFPGLLESHEFFCKISRPWKVPENGFCPGNFSARSWKVLEFFARLWRRRQTQWCRCRCQNIRVTSFPTICLLFLSDSDQRILEYGCSYHTMYIYIYVVSNFCLSLYVHVAGVWESPEKMFLGYWKVLEIFLNKRVGTLDWCMQRVWVCVQWVLLFWFV